MLYNEINRLSFQAWQIADWDGMPGAMLHLISTHKTCCTVLECSSNRPLRQLTAVIRCPIGKSICVFISAQHCVCVLETLFANTNKLGLGLSWCLFENRWFLVWASHWFTMLMLGPMPAADRQHLCSSYGPSCTGNMKQNVEGSGKSFHLIQLASSHPHFGWSCSLKSDHLSNSPKFGQIPAIFAHAAACFCFTKP